MKHLIFAVAAVSIICASGCQNTAEGMKEDATINQKEATKAAENAGAAISESSENVEAALVLTGPVKSALMDNEQLRPYADKFDVDSDEATVTINGSVPTAELKELATEVAMKVLKEKNASQTLTNKLEINP